MRLKFSSFFKGLCTSWRRLKIVSRSAVNLGTQRVRQGRNISFFSNAPVRRATNLEYASSPREKCRNREFAKQEMPNSRGRWVKGQGDNG